jgi:RNA polymerase sigma factor (sigma-70 family)
VNHQIDQQLLREYVERRADAAFAKLVQRHVDLVYSAALRMLRDTHLAEDVAQSVFVALAQNARQLQDRASLSGWLHRTTHHLAANVIRSDVRRRAREQEAVAMKELLPSGDEAVWEQIAPHLDDALSALSDADRDAIVLRYFERKSARQMADAFGISEEAAQKRVSRAVERVRNFLSSHGVSVGASGLIVGISANAVQAAPAALALTISASAAGIGASSCLAATVTKAAAMTTLQKTIATISLVAVIGTAIYEAHQATNLRARARTLERGQAPLAERIQELTRERDAALARVSVPPAPRLPAPIVPVSAAPATQMPSTNLYARFSSEAPKLKPEQVANYLQANHRNASSLLAAYRTTSDPALLDEAMQKFPDNPQVAFEAVFKKDLSPETRRQWLDAFKKADSNNGLANYVSALDYFRSGQTDRAVQEFIAASGKPFQDYTSERYQDDAEAFLGAGYSVADAKTASAMELLLPQLAQVKELGLTMIELSKSYQAAGDTASAQAALQMAVQLGQRYSTPSPGEATISQLVGLHLERIALNAMDPNSTYASGQTVQERISQITQQKNELEEHSRQVESIFPKMAEQDWINYRDRWLKFGEQNAAQWLISKYGRE